MFVFTASSKCQAHGICQHANADGTDVAVTLCPRHQRAPIWPEPCQPPHSFQCSDFLSFSLILKDPTPRQPPTSYLQKACGVYELGKDPIHHRLHNWVCYYFKVEKPYSSICLPIPGWIKSLCSCSNFKCMIYSTRQMGSIVGMYQRSVMIVQFSQGWSCDSETLLCTVGLRTQLRAL